MVTSGLPNSVIFNYDATRAPGDSVIIQQSWDKTLRKKVSKNNHQHISIYYYPDFYNAKLIVGGRIVKQHELFIQSDGWLAVVDQKPVPVYFDKQDIVAKGKLTLPAKSIIDRNIRMQPVSPYTVFSRVQDFGEIYSDDFTFETLLRNDYREGASICQQTTLYLLCEGTAIGIPLCAKGCVSDLDLLFTNYTRSGKINDLSAFGVDFSGFVKLRIESHKRKAQIYINNKQVYSINSDIIRSKIIGIDYRFQGTGSVDYVKLTNGRVTFQDNF